MSNRVVQTQPLRLALSSARCEASHMGTTRLKCLSSAPTRRLSSSVPWALSTPPTLMFTHPGDQTWQVLSGFANP